LIRYSPAPSIVGCHEWVKVVRDVGAKVD